MADSSSAADTASVDDSVLKMTTPSPSTRRPQRKRVAAKPRQAKDTAARVTTKKVTTRKVTAEKTAARKTTRTSRSKVGSPLQPKRLRKPKAAAKASGSATAPLEAVHPTLLVGTADSSLEHMLRFALEQVHLSYQLFSSGTLILQALLSMPVGVRAPIVVLDVDLPGVDGHSILERIGVERPDTFLIIVLSSHADESVQVRSLLAGAVDHLAKPFNVRVLLAKLQRWVAISGNLLGSH